MQNLSNRSFKVKSTKVLSLQTKVTVIALRDLGRQLGRQNAGKTLDKRQKMFKSYVKGNAVLSANLLQKVLRILFVAERVGIGMVLTLCTCNIFKSVILYVNFDVFS